MSVQAGRFDKISPTAFLVAYARQFTDIPYAKELAQLVEAHAVVESLLGQAVNEPAVIAALIEARYKTINHVMSQYEATQVLELASGLLPRGMKMSENSNVIFIESDLPAIINRKQQLLRQLIGERQNLHFIVIDATSIPSQFPLHADYLNAKQPVVILCEGLLMYLSMPEKQQVFANIREMLEHYTGVWITPDLNTKDRLEQRLRANPALQNLAQMITETTGRSTANVFDTLADVNQFAVEQGFHIEEHSMLDVVDQLTCLESLGIDADAARQILAVNSVFTLTLA